jgi:Domain of unknown function (DUF1835)
MSDRLEQIQAAFRLNLDQQKKRAKDLLRAARRGDTAAIDRLFRSASVDSELKLAQAQFAVARELGFASWPELKSHIIAMNEARSAIATQAVAPDGETSTLHVRCGSDIKSTLAAAGFSGDFLEHSYPYCHGPVTDSADHLEREAEFLASFVGHQRDLSFADALARRQREEDALAQSADNHERVVLWMEHDCFDQLVLIRCLAHYANTKSPHRLELININHFPGAVRFIGLGQLPPEAIRLLWKDRRTVTAEQLSLAAETWQALQASNPTRLATIMRSRTPALPDLAIALARLLRELPAAANGLSMTERLILDVLAESSITANRVFASLTYERDPLPYATDLWLMRMLVRMTAVPQPLITGLGTPAAWNNVLTLTDVGRSVLNGERDWLALRPADRWVGGVLVSSRRSGWRWDEHKSTVILKPS